jgi:hypothetical protein
MDLIATRDMEQKNTLKQLKNMDYVIFIANPSEQPTKKAS